MVNRRILFILFFALTFFSGCASTGTTRVEAISDLGDGTILNNLTKQMWTKKKTVRFHSSAEAQAYAEKAVVAGYDDWRLPTLDEFHTLYYAIDFGQGSVKKTGISSEGDIWVVRGKDGQTIAGAWEKEDTCCISRSFMESKSGRLWLVRP
ncbi:MAG: DUF1566 domain-containing protein [Thermodesulfobacteriota bacterium]